MGCRQGSLRGATRRDPEDLAEQPVGVLGVLLGVVPAATVPNRDVEVPVRAELELPAIVVVLVGVRDRDEHLFGRAIAESPLLSAVNSLTRSSQPGECGQLALDV
jgi:hypothetical protein